MPLQNGDIDHLVITRSGGVVVIDSKWRTATSVQDHNDMARSIAKVQLRADALVRQLIGRERGKHRDPKKLHRVTPALVVWGAEQDSVPEGFELNGIPVVAGPRLLDWLKAQSGDAIDKNAAEDLISLVEHFREGTTKTVSA